MKNMAKVLLADANEEFRALLAGAIEKTGEFTVVGSTGDGAEALRLVEEQKPDLLILDTVLPGMDGFGLLSPESAVAGFGLQAGENRLRYIPDGDGSRSVIRVRWYDCWEGV